MRVYFFGKQSDHIEKEFSNDPESLLGAKGAHLLEISQKLNMPVPPGIIIPTTECAKYQLNGNQISQELKDVVIKGLAKIEKETGKKFGDPLNPLLVSVRSGAKTSMPGMMDTLLNLGINEEIVKSMAKTHGRLFSADCYRRFLQMYSNVVLNIPHYKIEEILSDIKIQFGIMKDSELSAEHLEMLCGKIKEQVKNSIGEEIPTDPFNQLFSAIAAVFNSCNSQRAQIYRQINKITSPPTTAVNIQAMVFGNINDGKSLTGVMFSRNPSTGAKAIYGEYMPNAQGEDIVSGTRNPYPISSACHNHSDKTTKANKEEQHHQTECPPNTLQETMPELFLELASVANKLEHHYRDMQDIEFTVENGKLWILQTRLGKRVSRANVKIQHDLATECIITKEEALLRIRPEELSSMLHPHPVSEYNLNILASGLPASPGVGIGKVVFSNKAAQLLSQDGHKVILVREETSPEDVQGMHLSQAIVTRTGGMTSHAAVVCRGMGVPCVVGCEKIKIDYENRLFISEDQSTIIHEGDIISVDGFKGVAVVGEIPLENPDLSRELEAILAWADDIAKVAVRANAETENDCKVARGFGAQGIGLARTEHMFFHPDALLEIRKAIVLKDDTVVAESMRRIANIQEEMFVSLFETMQGMPVNIRLLDPPLHEFLPKTQSEIISFCEQANIKEVSTVKEAIEQAVEVNPMLGLRGCRLGIKVPGLYSAQAKAIFMAIAKCKKAGLEPSVEIMVPFVQSEQELQHCKGIIKKEQEAVENSSGFELKCKIGTMIELPRACIVANKIAPHVDYFSFGTNDLTQTTLGISRDDEDSFVPSYQSLGMLTNSPFVELDYEGVGELMKTAITKGKLSNPNIYFGVCGEHGGHPNSIKFACEIGVSYVSCSPYRVPIARLATAQYELTKNICK